MIFSDMVYNGITLSRFVRGSGYQADVVNGDQVGIRDTIDPLPGIDGVERHKSYYGDRLIEIRGFVKGTSETDLYAKCDALRAAFDLNNLQTPTEDGFARLTFRNPGQGESYYLCKPIRGAMAISEKRTGLARGFAVLLEARNPHRFSSTPLSLTLTPTIDMYAGMSGYFGGNDQVSIPNISAVVTRAYGAISLWFKNSTPSVQVLFDFSNDKPQIYTLNGKIQVLWVGATGMSGLALYGDGQYSKAVSYAYDTWNHLVLVWSHADQVYALYLNGELVDIATGCSFSDMTNGLEYVGSYGGAGYLTGNVDDVRLYSSTITQADVTTLYEGGNVAGAITHYKFNNPDGTNLIDETGNYNGTITGMTYVDDSPLEDMTRNPKNAFPITFPVSFSPPSGTASGSITNSGKTPVFPVIKIYGPCNGPRLENATSGLYLDFTSDVVIEAGGYLEIIPETGQCILHDVNGVETNVNQYLLTTSDYWQLVVGVNNINFSADSVQDGAYALLEADVTV